MSDDISWFIRDSRKRRIWWSRLVAPQKRMVSEGRSEVMEAVYCSGIVKRLVSPLLWGVRAVKFWRRNLSSRETMAMPSVPSREKIGAMVSNGSFSWL